MSNLLNDLAKLSPESLALLETWPVISPPKGVVSNFSNPVNRSATQNVICSIAMGVALLFFLNRVYVKVGMVGRGAVDDVTLLIAVLSAVVYYVACIIEARLHGVGVHLWDLSVWTVLDPKLRVTIYIIATLSPLTFMFLKASFFIQYFQLFGRISSLRLCSWIGLVITTTAYTAFTIATFVLSTPPKGVSFFQHQESHATTHIYPLSIVTSSFGLVIDLFILLIPIVGVWGLTMSPKRKLGVLLIFFSGAMACVCSACSIYFRVYLTRSRDFTWILIDVNICTLCEMFVGIICACTPSVAYAARQNDSLYRKLFTGIRSLKSTLSISKGSRLSASIARPSELHSQLDALKSTDRKYARYFTLTDFPVSKAGKGEEAIDAASISISSNVWLDMSDCQTRQVVGHTGVEKNSMRTTEEVDI